MLWSLCTIKCVFDAKNKEIKLCKQVDRGEMEARFFSVTLAVKNSH